MPILDKETRQLINAARMLGSANSSIYLTDTELLRLCAVAAADLGQASLVSNIASDEELSNGYYGMGITWFQQAVSTSISFEQVFLSLREAIQDFATYFKNLCALHKRRLKYGQILENQPIGRIEQIIPRCLLEFGLKPPEALASWLVWRKWLYDIDNRAAQETGYLFEPILASAIGGIPYSASQSPIKRADNPSRGRQVDCIDGKQAYEFKMRVTIAASGQGRFQEELDFARDCRSSGYTPILLVLDPTPSARLNELSKEYATYGGNAYIGSKAWEHIDEKAGNVMGWFVERYVRTPLREVDEEYTKLQPISLVDTGSSIEVQVGGNEFFISRPRAEVGLVTLEDDSLEESESQPQF